MSLVTGRLKQLWRTTRRRIVAQTYDPMVPITVSLFASNWQRVVLVMLLFACIPALAKTKRKDVVIMKNGDHISGEVKKLENGVLYIDTDYFSGSMGVDWLQVESVESTGGYQVTFHDGERESGSINKVTAEEAPGKDFTVSEQGRAVRVDSRNVVNIESQKQSFWRQLTGAIDFGIDFTSGNSQTAFNASASANYLSTRWMGGTNFTSSFSGQSGAATTNLLEIQGLGGIFLSHNSFLMGIGDFLHSSQQNLQLRSTVGAGYGRYIVRNNHNTLSWVAGTVFTHENFDPITGQSPTQNAEALLGMQYQLFHFDRYSLQSQLLVYPGLSDAGRVRSTTKTTFSVKLVNNFHTDFSFWDNFDSRPPFNSKGNELGVSNSLGWTF